MLMSFVSLLLFLKLKKNKKQKTKNWTVQLNQKRKSNIPIVAWCNYRPVCCLPFSFILLFHSSPLPMKENTVPPCQACSEREDNKLLWPHKFCLNLLRGIQFTISLCNIRTQQIGLQGLFKGIQVGKIINVGVQ